MKLTMNGGRNLESPAQSTGGGDNAVGEGGNVGGDERNVVVVGVKLNERSRELLTWALVKVAQPGDRVVALHVLHSSSDQQSSLLSLVKTFDSVIAVYEGFCHLKQVDLKLKVSRGLSVRKVLIREAKAYGTATVVVGASENRHPIRSPTSIAKHCARKLSHNVAVFAIDNGRIAFQRKATAPSSANKCRKNSAPSDSPKSEKNTPITGAKSDPGRRNSSAKHGSLSRKSTLIKRYFGCGQASKWADYSCDLQVEKPIDDPSSSTSLAMVPYQEPEASSDPKYVATPNLSEHKQGWALLRGVFLPKPHHSHKASCQKKSLFRHVTKPNTQQSTVAIHPDEQQVDFSLKDDNSSYLNKERSPNPDGENENCAIVPVGIDSAYFLRSPAHGSQSFAKELQGFHAKYSSMCRLFTYRELASATSGFLPERMIGKGGSSRVFKGCLSDGKELAVKILKPTEHVLEEFLAEIEIVTSVSHKNIISLLGFCVDHESPILVYDFLARGSLEDYLHGCNKDVNAFGLKERYNVALGVAEALEHLHNGNSQPVIHRDVKSSNILLSEDFEPQLSDFGLATWASNASSYLACADVAGTFGYLAPEYFMHGKVTEKIDVYAFGVVLLELLSGRKSIDNQNPKGQESLVMWARPILKAGKILQLLDAKLGSEHDHDQTERLALAANLCLRRAPLFRPRIDVVLKLLQGDAEITKWSRQQVNNDDSSDFDAMDKETSPKDVIQSHLNLALLDLEDDDYSVSSCCEPSVSIEDYLKGRWSRSPSFD